MLPFRKILCPTDFSDLSRQALEVAIQLAQEFGAEVCLLHVVAPCSSGIGIDPYGAGGYYDTTRFDKENLELAETRLSELIAAHVPENVKAHGLTRLGNATWEIESAINEQNADLLVIATRGLTGWRHLVFGSVTEKAVRMVSCPVLAVHDRGEGEEKKPLLPLRKILCPTDFSEPSRLALSKAGELARHYDAELVLLHVTWAPPQQDASDEGEVAAYDRLKVSEAQAKLGEMIAENAPPTTRTQAVVRLGNTVEEIERTAKQEDADLIVIATHGASGWHRLFYGSVAERVLRTTHFPTLIIHEAVSSE
jgi:nucleotide-binding universal stress UspA family protein